MTLASIGKAAVRNHTTIFQRATNRAIENLARVCPDRLRTSSQEGTVGFAWAFSQGPASGSPLFAWSLTNGYEQPLDYHLVFYLYAFMSVIILVWSLLLPTSVNLSPVCLARGELFSLKERRSFAKTGSDKCEESCCQRAFSAQEEWAKRSAAAERRRGDSVYAKGEGEDTAAP